MKGNKLFLYSLGSLAVLSSSVVSAEEIATAPELEGGFSAMIGGFYMVPSTDNQTYNTHRTFDTDLVLQSDNNNFEGEYDFGFQAAIGYVFDGTANGIELSYRNLDSSSSGNQDGFNLAIDQVFDASSNGVNANQSNQYEDWDLMVSQFLDVGTHVQMRFMGGISYLSKLNQTTNVASDLFVVIGPDEDQTEVDLEGTDSIHSEYDGLGPRVGLDARYDFGNGFGVLGGASLAYFLGDLDTNNNGDLNVNADELFEGTVGVSATDTQQNHAVTNLRANLAVDYVYYFENQDLPTLGLELGYEVDTYFDGVSQISVAGGQIETSDITFSGPYLNLKGVF